MGKTEWIETRKECEVTETGELVTRRVTLERTNKRLEKKDQIDIMLRFLGLAAIFIPLWLFFQQQQSERDKQKALFQLDLYSNTTSELHSMINRPMHSAEFEQSTNKILYELYPKVVLLNDKAVIDSFRVIKDMIGYSVYVTDIFRNADSLFRLYNSDASDLPLVINTIAGLRNSLDNILHLENETTQGENFAKPFRQPEMKALGEVNSLYTQLTAFTESDPADTTTAASVTPSFVSWLYDTNNDTRFHLVMDVMHELRSVYPREFITHMTYNTSTLDSTMIRSNALLYKH